MKEKETITKDNYKEKTLKRAIVICWVLIAICFVVKICGGNFFNINVENENFIKFCNYLDNSWFRFIVYYMFYCFESYALLKIIKPEIKIKSLNFLFYISLLTIYWIIKLLLELKVLTMNDAIFSIGSMFLTYFMLSIFSKSWVRPIIVIVYQVILVTITSFIKNLSFLSEITCSFLNTTIFCIDYYILLVLTILYGILKLNKKEKRYGIN